MSKLGGDPEVDGVILDVPVPAPLDPARLVEAIPAEKDVEGVTAQNLGRLYAQKSWDAIKKAEVLVPCTANAIAHLVLEAKVPLAGRHAVVVGRSTIVGRPTAHLLSTLDATVTLCHSKSADLARYVADAGVLVTALGKPGAVKGAWVKPGAVVADAGISTQEGQLVGDVEAASAAQRAAWLTPVPGGVGPLTVTFLLYNTVLAAERRTKRTLMWSPAPPPASGLTAAGSGIRSQAVARSSAISNMRSMERWPEPRRGPRRWDAPPSALRSAPAQWRMCGQRHIDELFPGHCARSRPGRLVTS